jgi:hypothetical protein
MTSGPVGGGLLAGSYGFASPLEKGHLLCDIQVLVREATIARHDRGAQEITQ